MATRQQVLSLFGATPEQIQQREREQLREFLASQRTPETIAGSAIGLGLARLFGGESADVVEARKLQGVREGLDLTTEEGMRDAARRLQEAGFEDRALQILDMADRKATAEQARDISQIKIIDKQVTRPVTTVDEFGETRTTAVKINVPHKFNILTDELTPIFDEETMQSMAQEQAGGVKVEVESESPESRARSELLDRIDRIPVGGVENIGGRYIRRIGPGPNDIVELTLEEVRQIPTEAQSTVDRPVMP
jgi:hypothetical protein